MRKLLMVVAAGLLSVSAVSQSIHAQGSAATTTQQTSIAGEWNVSYNTPGGARAFRVVFIVDGQKLTGTVKRDAGDSPLAGTIKGDSVSFSYSIMYGDNTLQLTVNAKVAADAMKGSVDFAGQAQEAFEARKISGPAKK